jgi:hypothetical protein
MQRFATHLNERRLLLTLISESNKAAILRRAIVVSVDLSAAARSVPIAEQLHHYMPKCARALSNLEQLLVRHLIGKIVHEHIVFCVRTVRTVRKRQIEHDRRSTLWYHLRAHT